MPAAALPRPVLPVTVAPVAPVTAVAVARGPITVASVAGQVLTRRLDGALLALFTDKWRLAAIQREKPGIMLDTLVAGTE